MPLTIAYVAAEQTPLMTAEAFRVRVQQSGFAARVVRGEGDEIELEIGDVRLWLFVEGGFVAEIECEVTFVEDRRSKKLLELIESMGWMPAEE